MSKTRLLFIFKEEEREMRSGPPPPAALPQPSPSVAVPLDHENAQKWFYRDPQGDTQGIQI